MCDHWQVPAEKYLFNPFLSCVCVFKADWEYIINFQIQAIFEQAFSRLECLNATLNTKNI